MTMTTVTLNSQRKLDVTDIYGNQASMTPGQTLDLDLDLTNRVIAVLIHTGILVADGIDPNRQDILDTVNNIRAPSSGGTGGGGGAIDPAQLAALQASIDAKTTLADAEAQFQASLAAHEAGDATDAELAAVEATLAAAAQANADALAALPLADIEARLIALEGAPDDPVSTEAIKQAQNLSVGIVTFREERDGDIVSQIDGPTTPNTVFSNLLGSQLNTDTDIMRWVATYDGTLTRIDVLMQQLQPSNAGGLADFTVTNTDSGVSGNTGGNWGTQGATFGNGDVVWTLPDLSDPVPFSVGDEIVIALRVNNNNSWAILSQNLADDIAWIASAPDSPAVTLNGSVSRSLSLAKAICQETGEVTYYDIDGNLVDVSGLVPAPKSADLAGPLMVGVGPTGERNRALYLKDNGTEDRPLVTVGDDNIERPV